MPSYSPPATADLGEGHVREALDFLIAVEPDPAPDTREEYEAATAPYRSQVASAMATLRRFAERTTPMTLQQMQAEYYGFTNDPRYLRTPEMSSVVTGSLNEAWDGVGPWRR